VIWKPIQGPCSCISRPLGYRGPQRLWQGRTGLGSVSSDERGRHCALLDSSDARLCLSWRKWTTASPTSGKLMSTLARPAVRFSAAIGGMCSIGFMGSSNPALNLTPCTNSARPEGVNKKSANIEVQLGVKRLVVIPAMPCINRFELVIETSELFQPSCTQNGILRGSITQTDMHGGDWIVQTVQLPPHLCLSSVEAIGRWC
jgi:hypothetical protein